VRGFLKALVLPFMAVFKESTAVQILLIINTIESMCYFGFLTYMPKYAKEEMGFGDQWGGWIMGFITAGISISAALLGKKVDKLGVRKSLIRSCLLLFVGRALFTIAPYAGPLVFKALSCLSGSLLIIIGYGLFIPTIYRAVKHWTTTITTRHLTYGAVYGSMNLGGFATMGGAYFRLKYHSIMLLFAVYTVLTLITLGIVIFCLRTSVIARALQRVKDSLSETVLEEETQIDLDAGKSFWQRLRGHPIFNDKRLAFILFAVMPALSVMAHDWLTMTTYIERAFTGGVSDHFDFVSNLGCLLIFFIAPATAMLAKKRRIYDIMIVGTLVMSAPVFFLAIGPTVWGLFAYLIIRTTGEALWMPLYTGYCTDLAPKGQEARYTGIGVIPWALTKGVTAAYSGTMIEHFLPKNGPIHSGTMWLIYGLLAISSTFILLWYRKWLLNDLRFDLRVKEEDL
jgi:MFS family permease